MAFAKRAWESVGGYPEWLTTAGEDTCFDLELKRLGGEWAFVPAARVDWTAPETWTGTLAKRFVWAKGDGESGARALHYWQTTLRVGAVILGIICTLLVAFAILALQIQPLGAWLATVAFAWVLFLAVAAKAKRLPVLLSLYLGVVEAVQTAGFIAGTRRQESVARRRLAETPGVFLVLSGVPIDDTGGGSRCTQIALELLRRGYAVVFVNKYPRFETGRFALHISHRRLVTYSVSDSRWRRLVELSASGLETQMLVCLIEFPAGDYLPIAARVQARGGIVVYDAMDAWDTSLGGQWYTTGVEQRIAASADVRIATVPSLADRLRRMTGRPVELVPNAVNTALFDPSQNYARPLDLPTAPWTAIYTGALWGEWFDWELLVEIGLRNPQAAVVVIGDYRGQCAGAPSNVHFLGLKPQRDLPAYLAHADVCIIPWKINPITQATSPLKVYEYLAMRRPVVAPDIEPLRGMPGVLLATNSSEFLARLTEARGMEFPEARAAAFVAQNNWAARVETLLTEVHKASAHV
ncbi:MAG: glycosyltransferase [Chloroflexi bacterium]|nr:glycosyltransferase [Chloroflexota bacterium]